MRHLISIFLFLLIGVKGISQEFPLYSHYYLNPYLLNPAYAGIEGRPHVSLTHRRQWLGVEDAPITSNITFHTPVVAGFNIGLNITQDNFGIFQNSSGLLTLGYTVPLGFNQYLSFGASGGAIYQSIDPTNLDVSDPALAGVYDKSTKLDGNIGLAYHIAGFNIGFSLQNIFNNQTYPTENFEISELGLIRNYIITADYMLYFGNDDYILQPFGNYTSMEGYSTNWQAGLLFHLKHVLWFGASYREFGSFNSTSGEVLDNNILAGLIGVKLNSSFTLSYAYEMPATIASGINYTTHEINLGIAFGNKKQRAKKYQTFIASQKPIRQKKEEKDKEVEEPVDEDSVIVEDPIIVEEPIIDDERVNEVIDSLKQGNNNITVLIDDNADSTQQKQDSVKIISNDPIIEEKPQPPPVVTTKGNHPFEIDQGHYVVVGAFGVVENAIRMNDKLLSRGLDGGFGYSSDKKLFYVYIKGEQTPEATRAQRDELRKIPEFKNAWYLRVD